jgi:hypothetical protein
MSSWFTKTAPDPEPEKKADFSLRIEDHPDTHLLQTLQISENDSIQILQLGSQYYALKKTKHQRSQPILIQDQQLCERIRRQQVMPYHLESLFAPPKPTRRHLDILLDDSIPISPPRSEAAPSPHQNLSRIQSDVTNKTQRPSGEGAYPHLTHKLQTAMAHFIENNPDTASALNLTSGSENQPLSQQKATASPVAAYIPHQSIGGKSVRSEQPGPPLNELTRPVVMAALQQASENQQAHLEKAQQLKEQLEMNSHRLELLLGQLPGLETRLNKLVEQVEYFSQHFNRQFSSQEMNPEKLLLKTGKELEKLQKQLESALTEALSLHNLLEIYPHARWNYKKAFEHLKTLIQKIVDHRHQVNYFLQQQAFHDLEQLRMSHLRQREQELMQAQEELRTSIEQLERINDEILRNDPLAVPEPVPALALHELNRLEHELNILRADPALKSQATTPYSQEFT